MSTIQQLMSEMTVSNWATTKDDYYGGGHVIRHTPTGTVAVWPYKLDGNTMVPHSRMHVKDACGTERDNRTAAGLLEARTVADIQATDLETNRYIVPFGPVGMKRALARWMREAGF